MQGNRGTPSRGGFVDLTTDRLIVDPNGGTKWSSGDPNLIETLAQPVLRGYDNVVFDRAFDRWVPAAASQIKTDGSSYVYGEPVTSRVATSARFTGPGTPYRIHLVDVATGIDRVIYFAGSTDYPVAYTADGIYLVTARWEASSVGLRILNPANGSLRTIAASGSWDAIEGASAWGFSGQLAGIGAIIGHVDRLDLATGAVTTWYTASANVSVSVVGFSWTGNPILYWYRQDEVPSAMHFGELVSPGEVKPLLSLSADTDPFTASLQADRYGFWLVGHDGVYLDSAQGLQRAFAQEWQPGIAGAILYAAGTCS